MSRVCGFLIERSELTPAGQFFATSPELPGLIVAESTREQLEAKIPEAIGALLRAHINRSSEVTDRDAVIDQCLEILHDEGWLGRSEQRMQALKSDWSSPPEQVTAPTLPATDLQAVAEEVMKKYKAAVRADPHSQRNWVEAVWIPLMVEALDSVRAEAKAEQRAGDIAAFALRRGSPGGPVGWDEAADFLEQRGPK